MYIVFIFSLEYLQAILYFSYLFNYFNTDIKLEKNAVTQFVEKQVGNTGE